jgi:NAD-dependent deacetylase
MTIDVSTYKSITVLTGAGISVASGLCTYRGAGGIWEKYDVEYYGHVDRIKDAPEKLWELFGSLRGSVGNVKPNQAHSALASLEKYLKPSQCFQLVTQNIDGLHQLAGSANVIELHGNIAMTRCSSTDCKLNPFHDKDPHTDKPPSCKVCSSPLIPNVTLFGEALPSYETWLVKNALRDCDLFLAIGTSGTVSPASNYVRSADYAGARTIYINIESLNPRNPYFKEEIIGRAEEILPSIFSY